MHPFELPGGRCTRVEEREIFIDSLLVRVHLIFEMSRPALRHGSLNSLFQVALHLPPELKSTAGVTREPLSSQDGTHVTTSNVM